MSMSRAPGWVLSITTTNMKTVTKVAFFHRRVGPAGFQDRFDFIRVRGGVYLATSSQITPSDLPAVDIRNTGDRGISCGAV